MSGCVIAWKSLSADRIVTLLNDSIEKLFMIDLTVLLHVLRHALWSLGKLYVGRLCFFSCDCADCINCLTSTHGMTWSCLICQLVALVNVLHEPWSVSLISEYLYVHSCFSFQVQTLTVCSYLQAHRSRNWRRRRFKSSPNDSTWMSSKIVVVGLLRLQRWWLRFELGFLNHVALAHKFIIDLVMIPGWGRREEESPPSGHVHSSWVQRPPDWIQRTLRIPWWVSSVRSLRHHFALDGSAIFDSY